MLSYRHGFHAGNYADVLKHFVLFEVLNYFNQKDKPYWYIDTHAGAGLYSILSDFSQKTGEYYEGFAKLTEANITHPNLANFVEFIQSFQINYLLYPGSPAIAKALIRNSDTLKLFELHPSDFEILRNLSTGRRFSVQQENGFEGLIRLMPPTTRRAITLIDPPYEDKSDYKTVIKTLENAHQKFPTGCFILWYPLLPRAESLSLPDKLIRKFKHNYLNVTLSVKEPSEEGFGMFGTGLFILNPPFTLEKTLKETLPLLSKILSKDEGDFTILANIR